MLRIRQMVQIHFAIFLLVLAALSGGISVFAEDVAGEITTIIYGAPVPPPFSDSDATWTGTEPDLTLPSVGTYISSNKGKLKVEPRSITITPDSKTKIVDTEDPPLTYQITAGSLVEGETLKGVLSRVPGKTVGSYSILQGDLTDTNNPNYKITFIAGKSLVITAASSTSDVAVSVKYGDSFSSRERMPDQSYGYSAVSGLSVTLYQEEPSKSASLQFDAKVTGDVPTSEPITLYVALPSSFSQSKKYYVRRTHNGSDSRLTAEIERHGDYYYVVFTTSMVDECTFRVIRKSSSSDKNKDKDKVNYKVPSFWEDVIDSIADARSGDRVRVRVGSRTNMAAEVLRELKGRPVTLALVRASGQTINIYGKDVGYISSGRDTFTMTSLANEYDSFKAASSAPVQEVCEKPAASSQASSSQAPAVSIPQPAPSIAQTWTPPPQSSSAPALAAETSSSSSTSSEESSSAVSESSSSSERSESEEPDVEIMAEEDEPYADADMAGSEWFPLFVVGALAAAGILAGIITACVCRGRRNSR